MKVPRIWEKQVIKSFFVPRYIDNKWYWLKRGTYILRQYQRNYYGTYPDRWFSDSWVNIRLCTRDEYLNYKYNKILPKR